MILRSPPIPLPNLIECSDSWDIWRKDVHPQRQSTMPNKLFKTTRETVQTARQLERLYKQQDSQRDCINSETVRETV